MKVAKLRVWLPAVILVLGAVFVFWMNQAFTNSAAMRDIFCGTSSSGEVLGPVAPGSPNSLAARGELAGRISMLIFSAFGVAYVVVDGIRRSPDGCKLKLRKLENADIFFDVPLYVGLFGTVSAFLVMTFSPQSSRLIAYSSTLIGIIFSLILRLAMLWPLRQKLLCGNEIGECGK